MKKAPEAPATRVLNIRDVPADLLWACREQATKQRITLRQFVLNALERAVGDKS